MSFIDGGILFLLSNVQHGHSHPDEPLTSLLLKAFYFCGGKGKKSIKMPCSNISPKLSELTDITCQRSTMQLSLPRIRRLGFRLEGCSVGQGRTHSI